MGARARLQRPEYSVGESQFLRKSAWKVKFIKTPGAQSDIFVAIVLLLPGNFVRRCERGRAEEGGRGEMEHGHEKAEHRRSVSQAERDNATKQDTHKPKQRSKPELLAR